MKEAMKLALDALEFNLTIIEDYGNKENVNMQHRAIGAIYESFAKPKPEQEPVALRTALADALGCVYVCNRTWSAWGVGTMTQDDFYPAAESDDVLDSLVEAVAKATPPAAQPAMFGPMGTVGDLFDKHVIANGNLKKEWIVYLEKNT
jgi:hypothetical protein